MTKYSCAARRELEHWQPTRAAQTGRASIDLRKEGEESQSALISLVSVAFLTQT